MRIAIVDESATRAAVLCEGLSALADCELFVVTERRGLVARIGEIAPDIVLMDLGNPSRDVLEEYFTVSRVLDRPIAMFVDDSDDEAIAASIEAGVSSYVVDGLTPHRIRPILDIAVRRFNAFARLQADLAEAKGKLAERDMVDQAKRLLMDRRGLSEPQARAGGFISLIAVNILLIVNNRSLHGHVMSGLLRPNPALWRMLALTVGLLGVVLFVPALSGLFKMVLPGAMGAMAVVGALLGTLVFLQILRWFPVAKA